MSASIINLSETLSCMAQPARIQILLGMEKQEACVCHLEAILGMSQASISQHLMILRKNGLVVTRRDGRHIYYSLCNPSLLEIFREVAAINQGETPQLLNSTVSPIPGCPCPVCNPEQDPKLACKTDRKTK